MKRLFCALFFTASLTARTFHKDFQDATEQTKNRIGAELAPHIQRDIHFEHANGTQTTTLIILIHGTFSAGNRNYFADGTRCFESMKEFARDVRNAFGTRVELISFGWNGLNIDDARIQSGKKLAQLLNTQYNTKKYDHIITVAQSHGGNIANIATHFIENRIIDTMVHLATPVREDENPLYKPINFGTLYAFYSKSDPIQYLGSFDINNIKRTGMLKFAKNRHFTDATTGSGTVYNIHTQINSYCPGHLEMRDIFIALFAVLEEINTYELHRSLELNVDLNEFKLINTNTEFPIIVAIKDELKNVPTSDQLTAELAQSASARQRYKALYDKDMPEYIDKPTYMIRKFQKRSANFRDELSEFFARYA